jgi:hypothetical protein
LDSTFFKDALEDLSIEGEPGELPFRLEEVDEYVSPAVPAREEPPMAVVFFNELCE